MPTRPLRPSLPWPLQPQPDLQAQRRAWSIARRVPWNPRARRTPSRRARLSSRQRMRPVGSPRLPPTNLGREPKDHNSVPITYTSQEQVEVYRFNIPVGFGASSLGAKLDIENVGARFLVTLFFYAVHEIVYFTVARGLVKLAVEW